MSPARTSWPTLLALALLARALPSCVSATAPSADAERRIAALEKENARLSGQVEALEEQLLQESEAFEAGEPRAGVTSCTGCFAYPEIDAVVLDVKPEPKLVVLDKGKEDGVKVGYVFDVYFGSTYRGLVRVTDVQEGMSIGLILSQKTPMARGDSASTCL